MLWSLFKLSSCLFGNTRDTSVMHEKAKCVCFIYMQLQKNEIQNCSNKHETDLALKKFSNLSITPCKFVKNIFW